MARRSRFDPREGKIDPSEPAAVAVPVERGPEPGALMEPTPWVVPTPPLNSDPSAYLAAMRQVMREGREAAEARARRRSVVAAPRRSLRRG